MIDFDLERNILEKQYENAVYVPSSGLSKAELVSLYDQHCIENPQESRILQRSFLIKLLLEKTPIALEKFNPFCGKLQIYNIPYEEMLKNGYNQIGKTIPDCIFDGGDNEFGILWQIDLSHVAPDWQAILSLGIPGLLERAQKGTTDFYKACVMVLEGLQNFCSRCGEFNENPVMLAIAKRKPETLYEAFQLALVYHEAIEYFMVSVRTMGRFDSLYHTCPVKI